MPKQTRTEPHEMHELSLDRAIETLHLKGSELNIEHLFNEKTTSETSKDTEERIKPQLDTREILLNGLPCLVSLQNNGIDEGGGEGQGRNKGMFNYALLLKKANGKATLEDLKIYNAACNPELDDGDLQKIIESVNSSDYRYQCKEQPLKKFCKVETCLKRKFGIGTTGPDYEN